jgi:hypothetical protein
MNRDSVIVGRTYTYHPTKENQDDNRHPRCVVEGFGNSGRVKIKIEGDTRIRSVSARALSDQQEIPL